MGVERRRLFGYAGRMWRLIPTLFLLAVGGMAAVAAGEAADIEAVSRAGAWATAPMTALLAALTIGGVVGLALTAWRLLAQLCERPRRRPD